MRGQVARLVWRSNAASVRLGAVAIVLAGRVDAGDAAARPVLRATLGHLRQCEAVADELDELRAGFARRRLEALVERAGAE